MHPAHRTLPRVALAASLFLAGCGGGGSHGTTALPAVTGSATGSSVSAPAGQTAASVTIDIPAKTTATAGTRKTAYVSPSVQSVVLSAVGGGTTTANLTSASPGCAAQTPAVSLFTIPATGDSSGPSSITAGPDGNMWFISGYTTQVGLNILTGGHVYNVTPGGTIAEQPWLYGTRPAGLTVGANRTLWTVADYYFTSGQTFIIYGDLVELPVNAALTAFPAPSNILPQATGITTAGGMVYFGATTQGYGTYTGPQTGSVDTSGNFTIYSNTTGNDFKPQSTGPDGLPWGYAQSTTGSEPAKLVGSNPVSYDVGYQVTNIVPGPDGNMWFTAGLTDAGARAQVVGKLSTSGTGIATYAIPSHAVPSTLTAGPDGNVWFAESNPIGIGRVTPSGAITEFPLTALPQGLAAGPDGNIWFTAVNVSGGYAVGRLTPPGTACTVTLNVPVAAPAGSASTVVAKAYDGTNGTGNLVGYASMPFTATAAGPNVISFTLSGVVANVKIAASTQAALVTGTANTIPLTVTALDADGNTIIPPGAFSDASGNALTITVTDSDTSGATSITGAAVTGPGQAASPTFTYTGTGAVNATISATVTGGTISGSVTGTTLTSH